ncbi:NADPH-dependent FMN reductase [Sphingobacterium sp. CZ-UAM]|uniref:NADPH-dependent FMN reductase n=1 Tax=Sphingobacterium sp. CZ-UAM TaxID=1933868 RepID=UPI000987B89E|nr:NADPH-dependent FMN reductase [Sphingobacterium sp. CZ-UAM]OOG18583.1 NADPH-dependent FMN reductase [Sphingobacterium sp. CZ-UAM]
MKALIFNGALERRQESTSGVLSNYFAEKLNQLGIENSVFNLADSGIPLFDTSLSRIPNSVKIMNSLFLEADLHFWLSPLYHGGVPGVMKNCLDWLEISAKNSPAYLTDKTVGLVCWADGVQALQGINAMDAIAKSLRAWTLPFSVPIVKRELFGNSGSKELSSNYSCKLDLLINIATTRTATFETLLGRS